MTKDYIADAISGLEDQYIKQAIDWPKKRFRRMGAVAAALLVTAGLASAYRCSSIDVSLLGNSENVKVSEFYGMKFSIGSSSFSCLARLEPEEIFEKDTAIFRGTVTDMEYYEVDFTDTNQKSWYTVYTIQVHHSIRGDFADHTTVRMLSAECRISGVSSSTDGFLSDLEIGTEGIFMPYLIQEGDGRHSGTSFFEFTSLGDCYISEGIQYLFVQGENGVLYDSSTFDIPAAGESVTLDDIEMYIQDMIAK